MTVFVELNVDDLRSCREYEARVLDAIKSYGANYTGLQTKDRYFIGACGELALHKYLTRMNVWHEWEQRADGRSDSGDFVIDCRGRKTIDIKNRNDEHATEMLVAEKQFERRRCDFYVGSTSKFVDNGALIAIHGIISAKRFAERARFENYKIPCFAYSYGALKPIEQAIGLFRHTYNLRSVISPAALAAQSIDDWLKDFERRN